MTISRRRFGLGALTGATMLGLRTLASGLPAALLLNPRKALADGTCANKSKARFFIISTSAAGDPLGSNVPGTYGDPDILHPDPSINPSMKPTDFAFAGATVRAAAPWSTLSSLGNTVFFHLMTGTPVHPKEREVLQLMGASQGNEMLPSILSKQMAPCLGTIQTQPLSLGAASPTEAVTFGGAPQPIVPPSALAATLSQSNALAAGNLQKIRDKALDDMYHNVYTSGASPAQKAYIDSIVTSQAQLRSIDQNLIAQLAGLGDDADSQMTAAVILILMGVTPVITVHVPFGGDNHFDTDLNVESAQTMTGVATINNLTAALAKNGLTDKVVFLSLNVFGRTMSMKNPINYKSGGAVGRTHNPNHHAAVVIGTNFKAGVVGGLAPVGNDWGCTGIDPATGHAVTDGSGITPSDTLGAFAKTMIASVGGDTSTIMAGQPVTSCLV